MNGRFWNIVLKNIFIYTKKGKFDRYFEWYVAKNNNELFLKNSGERKKIREMQGNRKKESEQSILLYVWHNQTKKYMIWKDDISSKDFGLQSFGYITFNA